MAVKSLKQSTILNGVAPKGSILQVVSARPAETEKSTTSTSYISGGLSASITPSGSSNKIIISWNGYVDADASTELCVTVFRDATNLGSGNNDALMTLYLPSGTRWLGNQSFMVVDSPATASAITYEIYYKRGTGSNSVRLRDDISGPSSLILMEVAA